MNNLPQHPPILTRRRPALGAVAVNSRALGDQKLLKRAKNKFIVRRHDDSLFVVMWLRSFGKECQGERR
jgi:hypothetical protein